MNKLFTARAWPKHAALVYLFFSTSFNSSSIVSKIDLNAVLIESLSLELLIKIYVQSFQSSSFSRFIIDVTFKFPASKQHSDRFPSIIRNLDHLKSCDIKDIVRTANGFLARSRTTLYLKYDKHLLNW